MGPFDSRPARLAAEGGPSLEVSTQLDRHLAGWDLGLFPDAAEASGAFRSSIPRRGGRGVRGEAVDPFRSAEEAGHRAKVRLRRYCVANRLNRLGTLTYAGEGCHDPRAFRRDVAEFFRRLRRLVGEPFAYAWVPEWHPGGHGLHAHFAVGRFISRQRHIEPAWGRGFVHIKLLSDLPSGGGTVAEARAAAGYLAKYVAKGFGEDRILGLHRFDVAEGFQPAVERIAAPTRAEVEALASERMGGPPSFVWRSQNATEWFGPPAVSMWWGR